MVSLFACAFFTALTGASGATIIALGAILYPAMKQAGYAERFNLGLITSSGSLGLLFPPSIALILYGVIAQQMDLDQPVAIDDLFVAGLLPGMLMLALLILLVSVFVATRSSSRFSTRLSRTGGHERRRWSS